MTLYERIPNNIKCSKLNVFLQLFMNLFNFEIISNGIKTILAYFHFSGFAL